MQNFPPIFATIKAGLQKLGARMLQNRRTRRLSAQLLALIPTVLWLAIHSPITNSISFLSLVFAIPIAYFIFTMLYVALLSFIKRTLVYRKRTRNISPIYKRLTTKQSLFVMAILAVPMLLILSLLFIDLISLVAQVPPSKLYGGEYTFLTSLYFGAFVVLGFGVSAYVASVRHRSLRQSEKRLEYTQQKDRESEVDRRMLEGIKLLGDKNESVRLGGIYILWEIVKDASKALPYLDQRHYNVYFHRYKDHPIIPYRTSKPLPPAEMKGQKHLRELYLKSNRTDLAQIKAYHKAFSLHEQVLSILCGHIRTLTNSEEYLLTYYPSLAISRFSKAYAERYDDDSKVIRPHEEEPGNEIQILFRLLSKKEYSQDKTLVRALNFKMNLASAILKGAYSDHADLSDANLRNVNFSYAQANYATFDNSSCIHANFDNATLNISSFTMTDCTSASFRNAQITNTSFKYANCIRAKFNNIFHRASFYGTTMLHTKFSYEDFINNRIEFAGINGLPGFANSSSLEQEAIIELNKDEETIYINPSHLEAIEADPVLYQKYLELIEQPTWRIPIVEAKLAHETLMRSGSNQQPGEAYHGHRTLEQIKTRDNLAVFHRMFKEKNRNSPAFYESLSDKEKDLVTKMFSDFDLLKKREELGGKVDQSDKIL
ncbi:pentapeptide repeat-containing protein [Ignatzschineria sp. LJL83]